MNDKDIQPPKQPPFASVTGSASSVANAKDPVTPDDFGSLRAWWQYNDQFAVDHRTPEEKTALELMFRQYDALRKLGWSEIIYCPKDGSTFLVADAGSTGVFPCHYDGRWPRGSWWVHDGGDLWPARPILWRPLPPNGCKLSDAFWRGRTLLAARTCRHEAFAVAPG